MSRFDLVSLTPPDEPGRPNGAGWRPSAPPPRPPADEARDLGLEDVLGALRRNLGLIAVIAAVTVALTAAVVLTRPDRYQAMSLFRIADERGALTGGLAGEMGPTLTQGTNPLLSQLEVLKGRLVLGEVVDRVGLRLDASEATLPRLDSVQVTAGPEERGTILLRFEPDGVVATMDGAEARAPYGGTVTLPAASFSVAAAPGVSEGEYRLLTRDEAIDRLTGALAAQQRLGTDAVEVRYVAYDPYTAQQVVNAAVEAFQAASVDAAQQQSRRRRVFVEQQLAEVDGALADMQAALSAFRSDNAVYSSATRMAAQQEGLMEVDIRIEELAADRRTYEAVLRALQGGGEARNRSLSALVSSPGVAANPAMSQLYGQLAAYQSALDSLTTGSLGRTAEHPEVQRLNSLVASTELRLIDAARGYLETLDARIAALGEVRSRNQSEIQAAPTAEAEEVRLVQRVETTRRMGDQLREELQRARIEEAVEAGQVEVVFPAPLPREPISQGRPLRLGLGLVLGLLLGGGAALVREQLDRSINRKTDIEELLRVPGLGVIPQIGGNGLAGGRVGLARIGRMALGSGNGANGSRSYDLVTVDNHRSAGAEAFRTLRTNLIFSQGVQTLKRMVVTSSSPGEGKTTTASNLAVSFAQQGMRVLLVDCDLRRARVHQVFSVPREPGLTEVVLGHVPLATAVRTTGVEGLSILPAGTLPPNPLELLGSEKMSKLLLSLDEGFDIVLLDTPPLLAAADASVLGRQSDGVVLVVRAGHTDREAALESVRQLHGVGGRVIGAVLNDPDAKAESYGYTYYDYQSDDAV